MKRKGFTLVELLAVIVILAVIALIATPMIMGVIENTKKGALKDSAYGLMEAGDIYLSTKAIEEEIEKEEFVFEDGKQIGEKQLGYKGRIEKGSMKLYGDGKKALCISDGKYIAVKNRNEEEVKVTTGRCSYNSETDEYETVGLCQDLQEELEQLKSKGDATAEDIVEGKTAVVQGELITGTKTPSSIGPVIYGNQISNSRVVTNIDVGDVESATFLLKKSNEASCSVTFNNVSATVEGVEVTVAGNARYSLVTRGTSSAEFCNSYLKWIR